MELSNQQINSFLLGIIEECRKYDMYSYILFDTLYKTGLRVNELIDYSRITIIDTNTIQVITQKFSNPRLLTISDFNETFFDCLLNEQLNLFIRSYSYYSTSFLLHSNSFKNVSIRNKSVTTHLFRHNYVKRLSDSGKTPTEIAFIIGERVLKNAQGYIDSIVLAD